MDAHDQAEVEGSTCLVCLVALYGRRERRSTAPSLSATGVINEGYPINLVAKSSPQL